MRPLCGRRGNDALLGRGGQARRRAVRWPQGNRPCCPVRQQADSPAYCRLPVGANLRLLALSCGLPYRATAQLGVNDETIKGTSSGERRYKARPCGPTNRAAAAAGQRGFSRVGGAYDRQGCRRIRGARLDWRSRMAVTWLFKTAGLVCAVCADLAGHFIVKSGHGNSAGFAVRQRRSCGRKAVSTM